MNSPYRELVLKQLEEIVSMYPVDGVWLDGGYISSNGCFCQFCRELFQNKFKKRLSPDSIRKPEIRRMHAEFKRDSVVRFFSDVSKTIKSVRKDLILSGNSTGDFYRDSPDLSNICNFNSREMHPPEFLSVSIDAAYLQNQKKPFERMVPEAVYGWGDWTVLPERTLFTMSSQTLARGGAPCIGHVAYPSGDYGGKVAEPVWNLIKGTWDWTRKIEPYCFETSPLPVAAILSSTREHWEKWHATPLEYMFQMKLFGAAYIFHQEHIIYDIINEERFSNLREYELLYLPDVQCLTKKQIDIIRNYVSDGGKLIVTLAGTILENMPGVMIAPSFQNIIGGEIKGEFPFTDCYVDNINSPLAKGIPGMPLLVRTGPNGKPNSFKALRVKPFKNSSILANLMEPVIETEYNSDYHVYHMHAPPGRKTEWPAIIHHCIGKGEVVFLPIPMEISYYQRKDPWLKQLFVNCIKYLDRPKKIIIDAPSEIEAVVREKNGDWYIHFIQIAKDDISGLITQKGNSGQIVCKIKENFDSGHLLLQNKKLPLNYTSGGVEFKINNIDIHEIVLLKK